MVLVFGQMNETPGARMRVTHASLTMAEYFRDGSDQDVLIFIDNVFRFLQAFNSTSKMLSPLHISQEHFNIATSVKQILQIFTRIQGTYSTSISNY